MTTSWRQAGPMAAILELKARLLAEGCAVGENFTGPQNMHSKRVHLYSHSEHRSSAPIPDDIIVGSGSCQQITRIRYNPASALELRGSRDGDYRITDRGLSLPWPVSFVPAPPLGEINSDDRRRYDASTICSFLGVDVLGVIPNNHCFYFRSGDECRFCEIEATYSRGVDFHSPAKPLDAIVNGVERALNAKPLLRHLAVTSGNVKSYDYTARMFVQIARSLERAQLIDRFESTLATLMPPDDLALLYDIKYSGFSKIYFSLEIHDPSAFALLCPGKAKYGYERILSALRVATDVFGVGNVYTNLVYGLQSYTDGREGMHSKFSSARENDVALNATENLLSMGIIPAFTIYHYGGFNKLGHIEIDGGALASFFIDWGQLVLNSRIVQNGSAVLFGPLSLANTLFNDGYREAVGRTRFRG